MKWKMKRYAVQAIDGLTGAGGGGGDTAPNADTAPGDSGGGDWRSGLPPELAAAPFLRSATSLEQAIADIGHAADTAGNSLRLPGPDAGDDALQEFYGKLQEKVPGLMRTPSQDDPEGLAAALKAMGQPDEATAYAVDADVSEERLTQLQALAHKSGLTKAQFSDFATEILASEALAAQEGKDTLAAGIAELRTEWGNTYEARMDKVNKMAELTGAPDALVAAIKAGEVGPEYIKWFYSQADSLGSEGAAVGGQGKGDQDAGLTPAEAMAQLSEVEARLFARDCPADQKPYLNAKRMELIIAANPEASKEAPQRAGL